jgi:hypothetical protein
MGMRGTRSHDGLCLEQAQRATVGRGSRRALGLQAQNRRQRTEKKKMKKKKKRSYEKHARHVEFMIIKLRWPGGRMYTTKDRESSPSGQSTSPLVPFGLGPKRGKLTSSGCCGRRQKSAARTAASLWILLMILQNTQSQSPHSIALSYCSTATTPHHSQGSCKRVGYR